MEEKLEKQIDEKNLDKSKPFVDLNEIILLRNDFEKFKDFDKLQNFQSNKKAINMKFMNIVDPIFTTNNLGKSVNFHNYNKMKKVFEYAAKEVETIIQSRSTSNPYSYLNSLLRFFNKTVTYYNPDLFSMHLPQPKIIIAPKNLEIEIVEKPNTIITNTINSDLISLFNSKFSLNTINPQSMNIVNIPNDVKNNLSNFVWPSRYIS